MKTLTSLNRYFTNLTSSCPQRLKDVKYFMKQHCQVRHYAFSVMKGKDPNCTNDPASFKMSLAPLTSRSCLTRRHLHYKPVGAVFGCYFGGLVYRGVRIYVPCEVSNMCFSWTFKPFNSLQYTLYRVCVHPGTFTKIPTEEI